MLNKLYHVHIMLNFECEGTDNHLLPPARVSRCSPDVKWLVHHSMHQRNFVSKQVRKLQGTAAGGQRDCI